MHDGRIFLLQQVLDFYDTDTYPYIQKMDKLDTRLLHTIDGKEVVGIPMTEGEKELIVLFLQTLTDDEFLNDTRFAKP